MKDYKNYMASLQPPFYGMARYHMRFLVSFNLFLSYKKWLRHPAGDLSYIYHIVQNKNC